MNRVISIISAYVIVGIFLFSLVMFLPASAMDSGNMTANSMQDDHMTKVDSNMGISDMTPSKQLMHSISVYDIKCKTGFSFVLKLSDKSPACVNTSSVDKLVTRGWAVSSDMMMKIKSQNMTSMKDMVNHLMTNESMKKDKDITTNNMENKSIIKTMPGDKMKMPYESKQSTQSRIDESQYSNAPALVGISDYINTTPSKLAQDIKGKVVVYDFWTFDCINCIHTLPHVVDLSNKYLGRVLVIGIHSPETIVEKDPNNVRDAVKRYHIQYPVVIDSEFQTWNAFGNHYWPHVYVADYYGKIRYDHIGEGSYDEIDKTVGSLLLEQDAQKPKDLMS